MFVSASPCVMCAKHDHHTNVTRIYYREAYRDPAGLNVLRQGGVEVVHYDRWRDSGADAPNSILSRMSRTRRVLRPTL